MEREEDRRAFVNAAYWDAEAEFNRDGKTFKGSLVAVNGRRVAGGKDFDAATGRLKESNGNGPVWLDERGVRTLIDDLHSGLPWKVAAVEEKESTLRPYPPFITSTLQQAASSLLGFSPRKTMQLAQKLYEGVDLGEGVREGLITYMRTDSVVLSEKALQDAGAFILAQFGAEYHVRRQYTTKSKMAQEAHEAIRPTMRLTPDDVEMYLSRTARLGLHRVEPGGSLPRWRMPKSCATVDIEQRARYDGHAAAGGSFVYSRVSRERMTARKKRIARITPGMTIAGARMRIYNLPPLHRYLMRLRRRPVHGASRYAGWKKRIGRPSTAPTVAVIQQRGYVERVGTLWRRPTSGLP